MNSICVFSAWHVSLGAFKCVPWVHHWCLLALVSALAGGGGGGKLSRSYQEQLTGKKVTYNSHGQRVDLGKGEGHWNVA